MSLPIDTNTLDFSFSFEADVFKFDANEVPTRSEAYFRSFTVCTDLARNAANYSAMFMIVPNSNSIAAPIVECNYEAYKLFITFYNPVLKRQITKQFDINEKMAFLKFTKMEQNNA